MLPRALARDLGVHEEELLPRFKQALNDLEDDGIIEEADGGVVVLAAARLGKDEVIGTFSAHKRGFGFLQVTEPSGQPELFVPEENNPLRAVTGDVVKAKLIRRDKREPGDLDAARILQILRRRHTQIAGTLQKSAKGKWFVEPAGNVFVEPIETPDAAGKYLAPGTRVVVDITRYPSETESAQGVISQVLGAEGEKDVDLKMILIQYGLPEDFPDAVKEQARETVARFDPASEKSKRLDLTHDVILTIDPDDAKDYDDAISLQRTEDGEWLLGVHIADVSYFVPEESPLDVEAQHRGNSVYFPGHVVPMLPEVLSNGVCSLQEGVDRLVKSAFIYIHPQNGKPLATRFANSVIRSRKRLRYREAQALIDGADSIPHPDGNKKPEDYEPEVRKLLADMNHVSRLIQKRRQAAGQLVLDLPKVDLVLNETGKVVDAQPEDDAFTHTLIEMFMVEANEAVGRLFKRLDWPAIRRTHPDPDPDASARLGRFVTVAGHKIPAEPTRQDLQALLSRVHGRPEAFAVNLAVLRSMARAEYGPEIIGHYALASDHYCHFTSPIRRYADLTVHRLLDLAFEYFEVTEFPAALNPKGDQKPENLLSAEALSTLGKHLGATERRADEAERELRQVKLLELMSDQVGASFLAVITGVTKFGVYVQLEKWLIEGLVRYPDLLSDFWKADDRAGVARGQRTGKTVHIGDVVVTKIARVDVARRELELVVTEIKARGSDRSNMQKPGQGSGDGSSHPSRPQRTGGERRSHKSKLRDKKKGNHRRK